MPHWTETAERVFDRHGRYLGECPRGDLWVPSWRRPGLWGRRFSPFRPRHWRYWLRSRLTRRLAFLEDAP